MKKLVAVVLTVLMAFSSFVVLANTNEDIKLVVDGKLVQTDVPPIIVNDRTMVPFRAIFEALDIPVEWNANLRMAYTTKEGSAVILTVDSEKMVVNGEVVILEVPPFISDSRLLVPARAICEALDCKVEWLDESRTVIVKTKNYVEPEFTETLGGEPEYIIKGEDFIKTTFELINAERAALGLSELLYDEVIEEVATYHSLDMAQRNYLSHTSPEGSTLEDRLNNAGVAYAAAGENLASGFISAESVFEAWKNSPSHYENLVNPLFTKVGIGYHAGGENGTYWTLVLIGE